MAVMTPCNNEGVVSAAWTWDWTALITPGKGSTICLSSWKTACLAAEFTHEHARVIVTRNAPKFHFNPGTQQLTLLPDYALAITINCAIDNNCLADGANLLFSNAMTPSVGSQFNLVKFTDPNKGLIHSQISDTKQPTNPLCLSMNCFRRGEGESSQTISPESPNLYTITDLCLSLSAIGSDL
jgi:hypothetical protein